MKRSTYNRLQKKADCWYYIVANQIFNDFFYRKDLKDTLDRINKHLGVLKALRDFSILESIRLDNKWHKEYGFKKHGPDLRSGDETYGYKSLENIEGHLSYISDRFNCTFRLQWMIDLPQGIKKFEKELTEYVKKNSITE